MKINNKLSILLVLGLVSCSTNPPINNKIDNTKIINISQNNIDNFKIDAGQVKDGASLSVTLNFKDGFNTKANTNGSLAKTINDIQSYEIYLIKNSASSYPVNGDPIGDKFLGPYILNNNGAFTSTITFYNIGDSAGKYYYVAVRAFDGANTTGNSLIKPNTSWTGTTSNITYNKQVAVSSGSGVNVSSTLSVTPSSRLNVTPNLIDIIPAKLDTSISVNNGTITPPSSTFNSINNIVGEFRVNTYTTNTQSSSSVSSDSNGNFVIVWKSNQDGNSLINYGIYAQRYNSLGIPQGSEFRINTYTTNDQSYPSIASDKNGSFIVTWQSNNQDGSEYGIYAQRYNSLGVPQGSEFRVNTYTTNSQQNPSIASDDNGNFVITWSSFNQDGSGIGIYAQRYNSLGTPQGSEFRVNTYTTNYQANPSISSDSVGNFVITWYSDPQDGSNSGIYAQRYSSLGVPQGSEFRVNTYTTGFQYSPKVACDNVGNFVITWDSIGQDGSYTGIYAQRYNSLGVPQGSEFRVNTYTTNFQAKSSICMDSNGNFVITWHSRYQDGDRYGVFSQRYNSLGIPQGSEFRVNTYTLDTQYYPSITNDSKGNFIISWNGAGTGDLIGIFAQRYSSLGGAK